MALWLTQAMAELVTVEEQHMDIEPPTVAIQAITWWEAVLAGVKLEQLQDFGLGVLLLVDVCCYSCTVTSKMYAHDVFLSCFDSCELRQSD